MPEDKNKPEVPAPKRGRERLMERYREKYKDDDFSADGALEEKVMSDLDENDRKMKDYESRMEIYDRNSKRLTDLFASNAIAAAFLNDWASGGDPLKFMLENFGDDFKAALESPEGRDQFIESQNKWLQKRSKDRQAVEDRKTNFDNSMQTLEDWRTKNNLTEDQAVEVFMKVYKIATDAMDGVYTEDAFDMAKKAMNYDSDVAMAREDGQVEGRNEKIRERLKQTEERNAMPPALSGQGSPAPENRPVKKKSYNDVFDIDND